MKFPSSILFLVCWLTRQWPISRGQPFRKPSISVIPSPQVILGEEFYIRCMREPNGEATFYLAKEGSSAAVDSKTASDYADFPLLNAEHVEPNGGIYKCKYCFHENRCSEFSDNVYVNITGELSPKPSISVRPSPYVIPGTRFYILCRNEYHGPATFYLSKEGTPGHLFSRTDSFSTAFLILNTKQTDGGIYLCSYCFIQDQVRKCSGSSDRVYVNITDPSLSKPSIRMRPEDPLAPGFNVTIECQGPENGLNFSLHKCSNLVASQMAESDRNTSEFSLFTISLEDEGDYTCQYHRRGHAFQCSEPSDPVRLQLVTANTFTSLEIDIRLGVAGLVLLSLVLIVAEFMCGKQG